MSSSLWMMASDTQQADNQTRYWSIAGYCQSNQATEANQEKPVRSAGTASKFWIRLSDNDWANAATSYLRKSRGNCNQTVSVTAMTPGTYADTSNTDSIAATDEMDISLAVPSQSGTHYGIVTGGGCTFAPSTSANALTVTGSNIGNAFATASQTTYFTLMGGRCTQTQVEGVWKQRIRKACTASNLWVNASAIRATATTVGTRKSGGNGNQSVSVTVINTNYEDTTNTDSLAVGDDFNGYITTGTGTDNFTLQTVSANLLSTSGWFFLCGGGQGYNLLTTKYFSPGVDPGGQLVAAHSEAEASYIPPFSFTLSELAIYCCLYTGTGGNVFRVRKNLGNGNLTVTLSAADTLYVDSSNSDAFDGSGDDLSFTGTLTSTSVQFSEISATGNVSTLTAIEKTFTDTNASNWSDGLNPRRTLDAILSDSGSVNWQDLLNALKNDIPINLNFTDTNSANWADALGSLKAHRVALTDQVTAAVDALVVLLAKRASLTDSNAAYSDAISVLFNLQARLQDSDSANWVDALQKSLEILLTPLTVQLTDSGATYWTDGISKTLMGRQLNWQDGIEIELGTIVVTPINKQFTDSAPAYADILSLIRGYLARLQDDLNA